MKHFIRIFMFIVLITIIAVGCGQANETEQNANQGQDPNTNVGSPNEPNDSNQTPVNEEDQKITQTVTLYFSDLQAMHTYRIDREIEVEDEEHLPMAALDAWISGPEHEQLQVISLPEGVIESVKDVDGVAHVNFTKEINQANLGSSGEIALVEQITMILQQFGYEKTQFLIEGEVVESLLGHMYTKEPIEANNPDDYEYIESE